MRTSESVRTNKTIAKNAAALFFRTIFTIGLSLYTSRVLLLKLGEDNFGIFSVVGGIAVLFSFLSNSLATATQRYLTLSLGHRDVTEYKQVFTTSLNCYLAIGCLIIILAETIGLYIINYVLNIPDSRLLAANYVYQFSLIAFFVGITNGPFRASIIAHEKFTYFAYTDIWVKILKLVIVYIMAISPGDKLIVYSALFMTVSILQLTSDKIYCHYKFGGCRYIKYWDYRLFKSIMTFSGFSLLRTSSDVGVNQGNNILVNVFGGTVASASFGLANQVWGTVTGFFITVQAAFNPQIIKSWGEKDNDRFNSLIVNSSKFSSYMVMSMAIPLVVNMPLILKIWLHEIPEYATAFCSITIFSCFISAAINPVNTAIMAIGKIKNYQIISSIILILCVPISFIALFFDSPLVWIYIIRIVFQVIELIFCSGYLGRLANFDKSKFQTIFLINVTVLAFCIGATFVAKSILETEAIVTAIISTLVGWIFLFTFIWCFGLSSSQRKMVVNHVKYRKTIH